MLFGKRRQLTSYRQTQGIFSGDWQKFFWVVLIALLYLTPAFDPSKKVLMVMNESMILIVSLLGLNLVLGYTGLAHTAHAAFMGVGAYLLVSLVRMSSFGAEFVVNFWWLTIPLAGMVGALFGAIVGLPSLRLKDLYLLIVTLAFQVLFVFGIKALSFFDFGQGISIDRVMAFGERIGRRDHFEFWFYVILTSLVVGLWLKSNLLRSRWGRMLIAVRDNPNAAWAIGIRPGSVKVLAFALGGFFAGIAGALQGYTFRTVQADQFTLLYSVELVMIILIGGVSTRTGAIWGVILIKVSDGLLESTAVWLASFSDFQSVQIYAGLKPMFLGIVTLFILFLQPLGFAYLVTYLGEKFRYWPLKRWRPQQAAIERQLTSPRLG